jgi:hypothetical protein
MADDKTGTTTDQEASSIFAVTPTEFLEAGKARVAALMDMQTAFFAKLQDVNKDWLDRANREMTLGFDFVNKLGAAKSPPEFVDACQDWTTQRLERLARDRDKILADSQSIVEISTRFFAPGKGALSA